MYHIKCGCDDPYSGLVSRFVAAEFPRPDIDRGQVLVDLLTNEILGTKLTRFGPKPSPEVIVSIRDVIRFFIDRGDPIPFVVPWGSEKPDGTGLDVAELCAIKSMASLNQRVSLHWRPGLLFNLRVEDASAPHLFVEDQESARRNAALYTSALQVLPDALELEGVVRIVTESASVTEEEFAADADQIVPHMESYLRDPGGIAMMNLVGFGWKGVISEETKAYYLALYEKLYPDKSVSDRIHILARYFTAALSRHRLGLTGSNAEWFGNFLELAFMGPIPGSPERKRRIYYRTVPACYTTAHMPPWRSKGYLEINNENQVRPMLASFREELDYNRNSVVISSGQVSVEIDADYVLA